MESVLKKKVAIGLIAACLILAVIIIYATADKDAGKLVRGNMIWLKCTDKNCGAEYQLDLLDYAKSVNECRDAASFQIPPIPCKQCGKKSVYKAEKCEKCGIVFCLGEGRTDFADRCPKCGYSHEEERRKKR